MVRGSVAQPEALDRGFGATQVGPRSIIPLSMTTAPSEFDPGLLRAAEAHAVRREAAPHPERPVALPGRSGKWGPAPVDACRLPKVWYEMRPLRESHVTTGAQADARSRDRAH